LSRPAGRSPARSGLHLPEAHPGLEGGGRYAAHEILIADATVSNLILDGHNDKIQQLLESASDQGSKSFNKDLYRMIKEARSARPTACASRRMPRRWR